MTNSTAQGSGRSFTPTQPTGEVGAVNHGWQSDSTDGPTSRCWGCILWARSFLTPRFCCRLRPWFLKCLKLIISLEKKKYIVLFDTVWYHKVFVVVVVVVVVAAMCLWRSSISTAVIGAHSTIAGLTIRIPPWWKRHGRLGMGYVWWLLEIPHAASRKTFSMAFSEQI